MICSGEVNAEGCRELRWRGSGRGKWKRNGLSRPLPVALSDFENSVGLNRVGRVDTVCHWIGGLGKCRCGEFLGRIQLPHESISMTD